MKPDLDDSAHQADPADLATPFELDERQIQQDRWRRLLIRVVALLLVLAFVPFVYSGTLRLFGLPSFQLLIESIKLSRDSRYTSLCQSIVAVQAGNRQGTGFKIEPQDLIVTNAHILQDAGSVLVGIATNDWHPALSWQQWPAADLALVQADFQNLPGLELESTGHLPAVGDTVTVIGNPLGLFQIVSQAEFIGQAILPDREGPVLEIRGPVFRGNSGSPVIDADGHVIGILFAVAQGTAANAKSSIAFVIPAAEILAKLELFQSK